MYPVLGRERTCSRSGKHHAEAGEHREIGMERDAVKAMDA